jgi:hypothetical protein
MEHDAASAVSASANISLGPDRGSRLQADSRSCYAALDSGRPWTRPSNWTVLGCTARFSLRRLARATIPVSALPGLRPRPAGSLARTPSGGSS